MERRSSLCHSANAVLPTGPRDRGDSIRDARPNKTVCFQHLMKALLGFALEDFSTHIWYFVQHSIPYYKAMASLYNDDIADIQGEEHPSMWVEGTKEERIAIEHEVLKLIAAEAWSFLKLFLAGGTERPAIAATTLVNHYFM